MVLFLCPFLPFPFYNHFLQRIKIISTYSWSNDFLIQVQFFISYFNLWLLS